MRKAAEVIEVVVGCAEDMKMLWEDSAVQGLLRRKKIRIEEEPGLYVNILSYSPLFPLFIIARGSDLLIQRLFNRHWAAS